MFMTLAAAFNVLLQRYTHQDDLCVGYPVANRDREELEGLIGFFVNTLGLRTRLKPGGIIGDFKGEQTYMEQGDVIAGNPRIFYQMISLLGQYA